MEATEVSSTGPAEAGPGQAPVLELSDIHSGYGRTIVLRSASLVVRAGSVTALVGTNGAGKTTLLKTASGLLAPSSGRVIFNGDDVTKRSAGERARRGMCHIPERRGVYRSLTVRENLALQVPKGQRIEAAERAVAIFPPLAKRINRPARTLSGGEQQMLALCAAYLRSPKLILVDEASLGLAPVIVDTVFEFLRTLRSQDAALLLVDQFVNRVLAMADYAYVLRHGEIAYSGPPAPLLEGDTFAHYIGE